MLEMLQKEKSRRANTKGMMKSYGETNDYSHTAKVIFFLYMHGNHFSVKLQNYE